MRIYIPFTWVFVEITSSHISLGKYWNDACDGGEVSILKISWG